MSRFLQCLAAAAVLAACGAAAVGAAPGADTQALGSEALAYADPVQEEPALDALATSTDPGTSHIGPVHSGSPDSGTCGNDWAQDTFDRFFMIHSNNDGTFRVDEQFKNGTFLTNAGVSPGTCDTTDGYGPGALIGGNAGTMHGYLLLTVDCSLNPAGCPNPAASCDSVGNPCDTTAGFLALFFPGGVVTTDAFFFHYAGFDGSNKTLAVNEWKNASCNRGGNHGDIANTSTGPAPSTPCVG